MPKTKDVGTSEQHTPIKHAIMREFVAKEVRAANSLGWIKRLVWIDLTAGNAELAHGTDWSDSCSPGILASCAVESTQPVIIDLYEKNPDTYIKLVGNLDKNLPALGYRRASDNGWNEWATANVRLRAWERDGREAGISHVRRGDAVLVLNDPNSITEWAMRRTFASEINSIRGVKGIRTLSCVGFNVSGIKRTPFLRDDPEPQPDSVRARSDWYGLIRSITDTLPDRLDLMLAGFARDRSQWAYLFSSPTVWRDKGEEEAVIAEAFTAASERHDYEYAWAKRDREKFTRLVDRRILTRAELAERETPALPFEESGDENAA
ncbi:hypothetical protein ABZX82_01775 [Streptomyces griseoflavus]|uniref:hypothetical protein n=1 Tax=Streptomyces griseoflavus TaxID=35619 RepID=UPI0033B9C0F3